MMPPPFVPISRPSKLDFDELTIGFVVDENMGNWLELYNWMRSVTNVEDYKEFKAVNTHVSTANLIILNSSKNPTLNVTFYDIYPRTLSSIDFSSSVIDPEPFVGSCTFKYRSYEIEVL